MRTLTIVFHLPNKSIYQVVTIGTSCFTRVTADVAFAEHCTASVHLDGERMEEEAKTTEQLFELLVAATAKGFSCQACGR